MISNFSYHPAVVAKFPGICAGVVVAHGLQCSDAQWSHLADVLKREQESVLRRLGDKPLADLPSIAAWRRAFASLGVKPTKYRNAAEALLRRLTKQGELPSVNPLVDIGNLISIRYALPVAVFDTKHLSNPVVVRFADGSETFFDLGADEMSHPEAGEVVFVDRQNTVIARRWCWRQSVSSAAHGQSEEILMTVEGQHDSARDDCQAALGDLLGWLHRFYTGTIHYGLLSAQRPDFEPNSE